MRTLAWDCGFAFSFFSVLTLRSLNFLLTFHALPLCVSDFLRELDLSHNRLEFIDNGKEIFRPLTGLRDLDMSNNKLHQLPPGLFFHCYVLQSLRLANNQLTTDDLEALNIQRLTEHLVLSGNMISRVPYKMFSNLGALKSVHLQNCKITSVDPNAFVKIKSTLETLDLTQNSIYSLKREMFQPLESQFQGLSMEANPILCDCGTKQFQDWYQSNVNQPVVDDVKCTSSLGVLYEIKTDDLSSFCDPEVKSFVSFASDVPFLCFFQGTFSDQLDMMLDFFQTGSTEFPFPDITPNPGFCLSNSSLTLSLLALDYQSAYLKHHESELPPEATVYIQLKEVDKDTIVAVSIRKSGMYPEKKF